MTALRAALVVLGLLVLPRLDAAGTGTAVLHDVGMARHAPTGGGVDHQLPADTLAAGEEAPADTSGLFDLDETAPADSAEDAGSDEDEAYDRASVPVDTAAVAARPVPRAILDRFRANPDYRYDGRVGERGPSALSRLWDWFVRTYLSPASKAVFSRPGRTVLVVLAFALLIALAIRLVHAGGGGLFGRRDAPGGQAGDILLDADRIEDVDLDALLSRARAAGRFRDATRFRFLRGLQRLAAAGLIVWERHKTDGDYLREVRAHHRPALTAAFAEAARAFAWVWYGEAPLDAARYARVEATLDRLDGALNAPSPPATTHPAEAPV